MEVKVERTEVELPKLNSTGPQPRMIYLAGGLGTENPKRVMDEVVRREVGNDSHNHYVEVHLDNPFVRVIILNANNLKKEGMSYIID